MENSGMERLKELLERIAVALEKANELTEQQIAHKPRRAHTKGVR